jgi:[acyl-carrier-protein] S-malonyltransferase
MSESTAINKRKKIGIVFSGQGAQYPGMGRELAASSPAAAAVFEAAGAELKDIIFDGTADQLQQTDITQPAVYTVDMAVWAAFREAFEKASAAPGPDAPCAPEIACMAGFSLGEYAALTASGVIPSFEQGLELVRKRGRFMAEAGRHDDGSPRGAMAAAIGERSDILALVDASRGGYVLEAVNFNSPQQTAIAGDAEAIETFKAKAKEFSAGDSGRKVKAIPLKVSSAFHSPIMMPAAEWLDKELENMTFGTPCIDVYLDQTGGLLQDDGRSPREIMREQLIHPVHWQEILEAMAASGVESVVELGPGKTLTGLTKKTLDGADAIHIEDDATMKEAMENLFHE